MNKDLEYSTLLLRNAELLAEIQTLKAHNELLLEKLNERLTHPLISEQELADQYETAQRECELYRQRFVWAMMANNKTEADLPKDEELPFILAEKS